MALADQQPGGRRLLLLRERASQRTALLPGTRAHCISVPRSAAQKRGRVSDTTAAAPPSSVMNRNLQPSSARYRCGSSSSKKTKSPEDRLPAALSLPPGSPHPKKELTTAKPTPLLAIGLAH